MGIRGRAEEALEALGRVSPATNRPYPLTMVCETWRVARSSVYALRARFAGPPEADRRQPGKWGPKTALSDEELVAEIRTVLKASPFLGEGHRKVRARLAAKGIRAALEPGRQGVRAHMGGFGKAIALGLGLRHDWGSQYRARQFQAEIKWLGIRSTPAYVGEPECHGVAERFIRALKEEWHRSAPLRNPRGGQSGDRGLYRALQQRLASPAAWVHDPGPCSPEAQPKGGLMFKPSTCPENRNRYNCNNTNLTFRDTVNRSRLSGRRDSVVKLFRRQHSPRS